MSAVVMVAPALLPADVAREHFLDCIRAVERVEGRQSGHHAELGDFQFKRATWEALTNMPFYYAESPRDAREVARLYFASLRHQLIERRLEVSVYNLALMWNGGATSVILRKHIPQAERDYARRVENLYLDR